MTEYLISIAESDDDTYELHDLYRTILDDDELHEAGTSLITAAPRPGQLGADEWVRLVLDNPALDTAVSTCVTAWLATRKSRRLRIVLHAKGKIEIEADGVNAVSTADVLKALETVRGGQGDAPAGS